MENSSRPYKILALAPFAPLPDEIFKPQFIDVDLYSLDEIFEKISPVLYIPLSQRVCSKGAVSLAFKKMKDFRPAVMLKNYPDLIPEIPKKIPLKKVGSTDQIDDILSMVDTMETKTDSVAGANTESSGLSSGLGEVFSNPDFQKTESAWRGLQTLLKKAGIKGVNPVRVSISSIDHLHLEEVLDAIVSFSFENIPNLVLIDLGFDNTLPSIERLEKVVRFADRMMVPVCVSLSPAFFRIDTFDQLNKFSYIKNHLEDASYAKFRKISTLPGSAWVMAGCNGFAARPLHEFEPAQSFISPVWGVGTLCAMSVNHSGWPMGFTKYIENRIEDLALTNNGENGMASTQALLGEDRIMQLIEAGITPLVGHKNKDTAFIPREASLSGDSIKFQMFFNRVIETLIHAKEQALPDLEPEIQIATGLKQLFVKSGHEEPNELEIKKGDVPRQDQAVFHISFIPPKSVIAVTEKIEFSFAW
ncbi:MAG: type VI secretion system contractile sheath large subunit [Desulfobacula sp.]|nr:type VI secretion system contractile sheath large subunit [Desulfobacula sp.]